MGKRQITATIPYFYEKHIENEKRAIKRKLIYEIAEELEENKK